MINPYRHSNHRSGSTNLVIIAVVVAIVAVGLNIIYVSQLKNQNKVQSFAIYKLKSNFGPGDKFDAKDDVKTFSVPESFHDTFQFAIKDDSLDIYDGQRFQRPANEGDILSRDLFERPDLNLAIGKIDVGYRRIAIPVNYKTAPDGLQPGVLIDIEANFSTNPAKPNILPVMEMVKVKAVGEWGINDPVKAGSRSPAGSFRKIDIEVTPEQATTLSTIAKVVGEFEVQLRNAGDDSRPKIPSGEINPKVKEMLSLK